MNDWTYAGIFLGINETGVVWVALDGSLGCTMLSETKVEYPKDELMPLTDAH
jgi:hypothetical protein